MIPTKKSETPETPETKQVQRTVFDLKSFDSVTLVKDVTTPSKPDSVEDALAMVGNDETELLNIIYAGLTERAMEAAREDMSGFHAVGEDGEPEDEEYAGTFADEAKTKLINGAVLSIAKLYGFATNSTKEQKRDFKERAKQFLRDNPAAISSIA